MSHYREIIIETLENHGEPAVERIRARPLPGQGFSPLMRVECSARMRESHPIGTKFKILARVKNRLGGKDFLYCHYSWDYEVVTDQEAKAFIRKNNRAR